MLRSIKIYYTPRKPNLVLYRYIVDDSSIKNSSKDNGKCIQTKIHMSHCMPKRYVALSIPFGMMIAN